MKQIIYLLTILSVFASCSDSEIQHEDITIVNTGDLTLGPIVHDSLSENQLEKIRYIQKSLIEVYPISIEETIENFKRDQNPEKEIEIWLHITHGFNAFVVSNNEPENKEKRKEVFKLLLMRSMMPEKEALKSAELIILTDIEAQNILENYQLGAKPITIKH